MEEEFLNVGEALVVIQTVPRQHVNSRLILGQNGLVVTQAVQGVRTLCLEGSQLLIISHMLFIQVRNQTVPGAFMCLLKMLLDPSDMRPVLPERVRRLATKVIELRASRWC
jgi:hypothetical protein